MKTRTTKIISTLIGKSFATALLFLAFNNIAVAQKQSTPKNLNIGIGVMSQICANGYGSIYNPFLYLKNGRRSFYAGPVIQKRRANLSGFQFNFTYSLTGRDVAYGEGFNPNIELYTFITAGYNNNALLGKRTLWEENCVDPAARENNVCEIKFKSAELYAGVGLKIQFLKKFKWINSMGVGGYTSFGFPNHLQLYYNASNIGLILKTGISYDFVK
ncbi:MAG TPA: hypothetical protein VNZ49_07255 [Bacteroidia bacterium]|jgi:hypothetical protein|nr:hypothetical protein [Bacteroidia bacterium]